MTTIKWMLPPVNRCKSGCWRC